MPERLSLGRFRVLAETYGSDIARWPEPERAGARNMEFDPDAQGILDRAAALDDALDRWRLSPPDRHLLARIESSAPPRLEAPIRFRARLWWSAIALAATLAGACAGALAASAADAAFDGGAPFGDLDGGDG